MLLINNNHAKRTKCKPSLVRIHYKNDLCASHTIILMVSHSYTSIAYIMFVPEGAFDFVKENE